ncbi:hypothetical protein Dsin_026219 [Dipteronia sinensis]|uniref:Amidase domain-containing protein n=1 Tax=Dipteronia sinensis TaxID=43782 RepID=A0AAD9ZYB5_9ROSI|nr:hypothetical protein Dsin_026219 [Dipteronia sinensis]
MVGVLELAKERLHNPYVLSANLYGSSSGSAISLAENLAAVSLGTETDGSILCPSSYNSVVESNQQPIIRTVADAVYVLDAIGGFDRTDEAAREASIHQSISHLVAKTIS